MSLSGDPLELDGGDDDLGRRSAAGWTSSAGRSSFWAVSVIAAFVLSVAWLWYGFVFFDEMTEACKAIAAGSSSKGLGALIGGVPVALAYLLVLIPLAAIAVKNYSRKTGGLLLVVVVLAAATVLSVGLSELVWDGNLFAMSADHAECSTFAP